MPPEYAMEGLFSEKSDVYSFGVLLLEIVSGRRNSSFYHSEDSLSLVGFVSFLHVLITCETRSVCNALSKTVLLSKTYADYTNLCASHFILL